MTPAPVPSELKNHDQVISAFGESDAAIAVRALRATLDRLSSSEPISDEQLVDFLDPARSPLRDVGFLVFLFDMCCTKNKLAFGEYRDQQNLYKRGAKILAWGTLDRRTREVLAGIYEPISRILQELHTIREQAKSRLCDTVISELASIVDTSNADNQDRLQEMERRFGQRHDNTTRP